MNELSVPKINLEQFSSKQKKFCICSLSLIHFFYCKPNFNLKENISKFIINLSFRKVKN